MELVSNLESLVLTWMSLALILTSSVHVPTYINYVAPTRAEEKQAVVVHHVILRLITAHPVGRLEAPSYVGPTKFSLDGDSVFLVGDEPVRFHVDSTVMCAASKFFAAMFSKRWMRKNPPALQIQDPTEFVFTQDDPRAFGVVLDVIYHTNSVRSLSAADLREVAILADKFNAPLCDLGDLLQAAYLFNMADAFSNITARLVLEGWAHFLETRRARIREKIYDLLLTDINTPCRCGWGCVVVKRFVKLLRQNTPSTLALVSVRSIMDRVGAIRDYVTRTTRECRCIALTDDAEMRLEEAQEMAPLCLECVRECKDHVGSCKHENCEDESESEGNDGGDDQRSSSGSGDDEDGE
ncbi:unnamed protein product [Parascedosporium putredinis]|uniref:BTB domain-containing protein n=1 Tax=Parascedosporium putredinis TaxID=1442378 RepID=A0A9P1GXZ0_9PEZI|nr:unnamed protein product [Parascedosporium putredinis]CAI7990178.1 unnamed protein product [Parascedosporium putredinis]